LVDLDALKSLPADKEVAIGVIDVRTTLVESPQQVAERIRKVLSVVRPERVCLTTDCGMKLAQGAQLVRQELGVRQLVDHGLSRGSFRYQ